MFLGFLLMLILLLILIPWLLICFLFSQLHTVINLIHLNSTSNLKQCLSDLQYALPEQARNFFWFWVSETVLSYVCVCVYVCERVCNFFLYFSSCVCFSCSMYFLIPLRVLSLLSYLGVCSLIFNSLEFLLLLSLLCYRFLAWFSYSQKTYCVWYQSFYFVRFIIQNMVYLCDYSLGTWKICLFCY